MSSNSPLSLLERQVALPQRRRLWLFVFACLSASMIGAAGAVALSLRNVHMLPVESRSAPARAVEPEKQAADQASEREQICVSASCTCPRTSMYAALTQEEWQSMVDGSEHLPRLVPAYRDGKAVGLKLYALAPTSLWARIGLENGDTLETIQGHALNAPEQVLAAYSQIQEAAPSLLRIELVRDGCPATLEIHTLGY